MLGLAACSNDDYDLPEPPVVDDYSKTHTMLMYMIADNSLSSFIGDDMKECCNGYLKAPGNLNLQVYIDNNNYNGGLPTLVNVKRNERRDSLIYDTLHVWKPDHNSADPALMSQIIKEAFSGKFDTPVKGIVLSSHGYAWTPSTSYKAAGARNGGTPEPQWFGQDNQPTSNYMELWELHDALKNSGVGLTHIMFDACFMSNAETAYELRDCAQYLIASVCEIPGDGYNYTKVIPELSLLNSKADLQNTLCKVIDCYGEEYNDDSEKAAAQLSLLDLSYMDEIAAAYKMVRKGNTIDAATVVNHDSLSTNGNPLAKMQSYGRFYTSSYYDYFDLSECATVLGNDGSMDKLLQMAVVHEFHASKFRPVANYLASGDRQKGTSYESFPFTACCGLSVSLPEMFEYGARYNQTKSRPSLQQMQSAYAKTQWSKFMEL